MEPLHCSELSKALAAAQGALKAASFDKQNPHFKSKYASLASIMDACRDALSRNGLAVIQTTGIEDGVLMLYTTLTHISGESVTGAYPIVPQQATPQGYGSAMTYARRYALAAIVGVVADDDDDGNEASRPPRAEQSRPRPQPQPTTGTPDDFDELPSHPASAYQPEEGEHVWADWKNPEHAKAWAMTQGKFASRMHLENAYEKVKADCKPRTAPDMWRCWYKYVMTHEPAEVPEFN